MPVFAENAKQVKQFLSQALIQVGSCRQLAQAWQSGCLSSAPEIQGGITICYHAIPPSPAKSRRQLEASNGLGFLTSAPNRRESLLCQLPRDSASFWST